MIILPIILITVFFIIFFIRQINKCSISPIELKKRLDHRDSLILIDVRNPDEFYGQLGHIEGSVLHPLNRIAAWAETIQNDSDPVILICHIGNRSFAAARILSKRGITAYNLKGGMVGWHRNGFPVHQTKHEE